MKYLLPTFIMLFSCSLCNAQILDSFNIHLTKSSNPTHLAADGNNLYFCAEDIDHGTELWTVINKGAPVRITDLAPGTKSGFGVGSFYAVINGKIYTMWGDAAHGTEIWECTTLGVCKMVADIVPGPTNSYPVDFKACNNKLYFSAITESKRRLWEYDPVADTAICISITNGFNPSEMTAFNNKVYYKGYDTALGYELFEYDPVGRILKLSVDIAPGAQSGSPKIYGTFKNKLYIGASDISTGTTGVFTHDGTTFERVPGLQKICPSLQGNSMVALNETIYFSMYNEAKFGCDLYKYSPASGQVTLAASIKKGKGGCNPQQLCVYRNKLYFTAVDDFSIGRQVWQYDNGRVKRVTDFFGTSITDIDVTWLATNNYALFFNAHNPVIGRELYRYIDTSTSVDVQNISFNADITIYPNPTKDIAHLQLKLNQRQSLNISVTDMSGRTIFTTGNTLYSVSTHTVDIPMHNMPQGNYVYSIKDTDGRMMATGKLQKL